MDCIEKENLVRSLGAASKEALVRYLVRNSFRFQEDIALEVEKEDLNIQIEQAQAQIDARLKAADEAVGDPLRCRDFVRFQEEAYSLIQELEALSQRYLDLGKEA
jgi:hypothetical protein